VIGLFCCVKNYYEILGLPPTASESQIKQVFRQLALKYHPDRNHTVEAENLFKELNEAYQVLTDPEQKARYDSMLSNARDIHAPVHWHPDPAYRRRQQRGYHYQRPQGPSPRTILMQSALKYFVILAWVGSAWCVLLFVDYLLPPERTVKRVVTDQKELRRLMFRPSTDLLVTEGGHHFPLSNSELRYFPYGTDLRIYSSRLLSLLIKVENYNATYELNNLATVYRNFVFAPAALIVVSVLVLLAKRRLEFRFNLGIVLVMLFVLNIVFYITSIIEL